MVVRTRALCTPRCFVSTPRAHKKSDTPPSQPIRTSANGQHTGHANAERLAPQCTATHKLRHTHGTPQPRATRTATRREQKTPTYTQAQPSDSHRNATLSINSDAHAGATERLAPQRTATNKLRHTHTWRTWPARRARTRPRFPCAARDPPHGASRAALDPWRHAPPSFSPCRPCPCRPSPSQRKSCGRAQ
jgi:hypothetical protein